ncbi:MAG: hypothetical protein ACYS22_17810 [Planctomycetota bacterium]|jgi:hypothetical protein
MTEANSQSFSNDREALLSLSFVGCLVAVMLVVYGCHAWADEVGIAEHLWKGTFSEVTGPLWGEFFALGLLKALIPSLTFAAAGVGWGIAARKVSTRASIVLATYLGAMVVLCTWVPWIEPAPEPVRRSQSGKVTVESESEREREIGFAFASRDEDDWLLDKSLLAIELVAVSVLAAGGWVALRKT